MSFIHDIIKRQYVYEGYLPNYPYYLISDKEMFDVFIDLTTTAITSDTDKDKWFGVNYPYELAESANLLPAYETLRTSIVNIINSYLNSEIKVIPDWIYSYMIGSTISVESEDKDRHDLLVLLGADNLDDEFTPYAANRCYDVSTKWVERLPRTDGNPPRPATMFGEPHVIKSLRLNPQYK